MHTQASDRRSQVHVRNKSIKIGINTERGIEVRNFVSITLKLNSSHNRNSNFALNPPQTVPPHPYPLPRERENARQSVNISQTLGQSQRAALLLPLLGERAGVRGNGAPHLCKERREHREGDK